MKYLPVFEQVLEAVSDIEKEKIRLEKIAINFHTSKTRIKYGKFPKRKYSIWYCTLKVWKFNWTIKGLQKFKKKTGIMTGI